MRAFLVGSALVTLAVFAHGGCLTTVSGDCTRSNTCPSEGGSGNGTSQGGQGGSGGSDPNDPCVPANVDGAVEDSCGVFVSSSLGDDAVGDGSKDSPFATMSAAIAASTGTVYACGELFEETVSIASSTTFYGGLDCEGGWVPGDTKTQMAPTMGGDVPVTVTAGEVAFSDFHLQAPAATAPGGSSIGAIIQGGTVQFARVDVTAGDGANGETGTSPTTDIGPTSRTDAAIAGNAAPTGGSGFAQCVGQPDARAGTAKTNALCTESVGGGGGLGKVSATAAEPGDNGQVAGGAGGVVASGTAFVSCGGGNSCQDVGDGADGGDGDAGAHGAGATALGSLSASGWTGSAGADGGRGESGRGGGGGAGVFIPTNVCTLGGRGGGAGGCGGFGGTGGTAGGGSFAVIVLAGAAFSTSEGELVTGNGGNGGNGGTGQAGAVGGNGATTGGGCCYGGDGGDGGDGGQGGGGLGGHSIAVAFATGATVTVSDTTTVTTGTGGMGGTGGDLAGNGSAGATADTFEL